MRVGESRGTPSAAAVAARCTSSLQLLLLLHLLSILDPQLLLGALNGLVQSSLGSCALLSTHLQIYSDQTATYVSTSQVAAAATVLQAGQQHACALHHATDATKIQLHLSQQGAFMVIKSTQPSITVPITHLLYESSHPVDAQLLQVAANTIQAAADVTQ